MTAGHYPPNQPNGPTADMGGIRIAASANEGLRASVNGRPVRLAIIDDDGTVLAAGPDVAQAAESSAVAAYRQLMMAHGHCWVSSTPLAPMIASA